MGWEVTHFTGILAWETASARPETWLVIHKHLLSGLRKHTESLPLPSEAALFLLFFPRTVSYLDSLHFCMSPSWTTLTPKPNHKVNVGRGLPYEEGVSISPAWPWASSAPWHRWSHPEALTQSHRNRGTRRANAAGSEPHIAAVCQRAVSNLQRVTETQLPGSHIFPPVMYPHTYTESEGFFFSFFLLPSSQKKQQQLLVNGKQEHNTASIQTVPDFCKLSATAVFNYSKALYDAYKYLSSNASIQHLLACSLWVLRRFPFLWGSDDTHDLWSTLLGTNFCCHLAQQQAA